MKIAKLIINNKTKDKPTKAKREKTKNEYETRINE